MFQSKNIKIKNTLRAKQRENRIKKDNWYITPPKSQVKLSKWTVYYKLQKKFGYDYQTKGSKTLKYMQEDFENKTFAYLGNREWTKNLATKDKYQRNLKYGHPLKRNPLLAVFEKLENKIISFEKNQALTALRNLKN